MTIAVDWDVKHQTKQTKLVSEETEDISSLPSILLSAVDLCTSLDPDQAQQDVGPDLVPNSLAL